jgi:hypothetical protein
MKKVLQFLAFALLLLSIHASSQKGAIALNQLVSIKALFGAEALDSCDYTDDWIGLQKGYRIKLRDSEDRITDVDVCFLGRKNKNYVRYIAIEFSERSNYGENLYNLTFAVGLLVTGCLDKKIDETAARWLSDKLGTGKRGSFQTNFAELGVHIDVQHYSGIDRGSAALSFWRDDSPNTPKWARYCVFK